MRMILQRDYGFEAAHFLPRVPAGHPCARVHGHSYSVSISIEGQVNATTGWIMDFADIDAHVAPLMNQLDHRLLNEIDGLANPTSELLAAWLWMRLRERIPQLTSVEISETRTSRCIYRGD